MINVLPDLPDNVIALEARGRVTKDDYETTVLPAIDEKQHRYDKVRLLYVLGAGFDGYTAGAMWEDATLAFKKPGSWEKIAIVSDDQGLRRAIALVSWMMPGETKLYATEEIEAARGWVAA
jgi:hypothetical protein